MFFVCRFRTFLFWTFSFGRPFSGQFSSGRSSFGRSLDILPPPGCSDQLTALLNALNLYRAVPYIEKEDMQHVFLALDDTGDHKIDEAEFLDLCEAIGTKFIKLDEPPFLQVRGRFLSGCTFSAFSVFSALFPSLFSFFVDMCKPMGTKVLS